MKKLAIGLLICACFLLASFIVPRINFDRTRKSIAPCENDKEQPDKRYFGGRVTHHDFGAPIKDFDVYLMKADGSEMHQTRTNNNGEFRFCGIASRSERWQVTINADTQGARGRADGFDLLPGMADTYAISYTLRLKSQSKSGH